MPTSNDSPETPDTSDTSGTPQTPYTFAEYQVAAVRTARRHDGSDSAFDYRLANFALGLAGEAGEVADALKKHLFHDKPLDRDAIKKELGDCLWYIATLADTLEIPLGDIARANVAKLMTRYPAGFTVEDSHARRDVEGGEVNQ